MSQKFATIFSLIVLLVWYFFDPKNQKESIEITDIQTNLQRELEILQSSLPVIPIFDIKQPKFKESFYQNITGFYHGNFASTLDKQKGTFELQLFVNEPIANVYFVEGGLKIQYFNQTWIHHLVGAHFPTMGTTLLTSYQKGWDPVLSRVPKLVPVTDFDITRSMMINSTAELIRSLLKESKDEKKTKRKYPKPRSDMGCLFDIYIQLKPVEFTLSEMEVLEAELLLNQGRTTVTPPDQNARIEIKSHNCKLHFESGNVYGIVSRVYESKVYSAIFFFVIICLCELFITLHQMQLSHSPMSRNKLSPDTWVMMAFIDLFHTIVLLSFALQINDRIQSATLSLAFLKCIQFAIFEIPFVFSIFVAQTRIPHHDSFDQFKYHILLLAVVNLALIMYLQYRESLVWVTFFSYGFWIPQIIQNTIRNHSRPLKWWFIIGISICRGLTPLYVWVCPFNVVQHQLYSFSGLVLLSWLAFQVWILYMQDRFGPRYYIPTGYLPMLYDYHPASLPNSECGICFGQICTNDDPQDYMVTPCNHVYHTECLIRWIEIKLECPICRTELPIP
jgi:transmembrane E3 ubiquitin-protein ligase